MNRTPRVSCLVVIAVATPLLVPAAQAPKGRILELTLQTDVRWPAEQVVTVPFELRNTSRDSTYIAQIPGISMGISCSTKSGMRGTGAGSASADRGTLPRKYFVRLAAGESLIGREAVVVPAECRDSVTIHAQYESAPGAWNLAIAQTRVSAPPLTILIPGDRSSRDRSAQTVIQSEYGGALTLAVGDLVRLADYQYRCLADECFSPRRVRVAKWQSLAPQLLSVSSDGVAQGLAAGRAKVIARTVSTLDTAELLVVPPVSRLSWTAHQSQMRVGDTLRVGVIGIDASGNVVARIAPASHIGGTGMSGIVLDYDDHAMAVVQLDRPGTVVLVARLAHRTDTLRIRVFR